MILGLVRGRKILVLLHLRVNVFIPLDRIFPDFFSNSPQSHPSTKPVL